MYGEEWSVHEDSGYLDAKKREEVITRDREGRKIHYYRIKRREREKFSVRAKVEPIFGVVMGLFGYRKTWYKE